MAEAGTLDLVMVREALRAAMLGFDFQARVVMGSMGDREIVVMEVRYHDISFDDLVRVSKALGTTRINVGNEVREGGHCDTCRHSYSITVLTAWDVVLPRN